MTIKMAPVCQAWDKFSKRFYENFPILITKCFFISKLFKLYLEEINVCLIAKQWINNWQKV